MKEDMFMKVMLVNGSSHIHGTTMKALEEMVRIFEEEGIETEIIQWAAKPLCRPYSVQCLPEKR